MFACAATISSPALVYRAAHCLGICHLPETLSSTHRINSSQRSKAFIFAPTKDILAYLESPFQSRFSSSPIARGFGDSRIVMDTDPTSTYTPFFLAWKHIETDPHHPEPRRCYHDTSFKNPPMTKEAFKPARRSPVHAWTPGRMEPVPDSPNWQLYMASSVFWRPDHQTYLTVPYDCTHESVQEKARTDELQNWERIMFGHESINGRCVSVLGHRKTSHLLAAAGPSDWMPELVPYTHQRHEDPAFPATQGTSLLAGDISILMGLAALSTSPENTRQTIQTSFRTSDRHTWVPHGGNNIAGEINSLLSTIALTLLSRTTRTWRRHLHLH